MEWTVKSATPFAGVGTTGDSDRQEPCGEYRYRKVSDHTAVTGFCLEDAIEHWEWGDKIWTAVSSFETRSVEAGVSHDASNKQMRGAMDIGARPGVVACIRSVTLY